ncbi:MAG: rRNA pseudouridine synthase [Lentisphaeria bacterium]|nr:rRNA pseudouridine synthase [Lentisphaeria bacterium]
MRLDKFLSDSAKYSRKEIRKLIRYRAVAVDGEVCIHADRQVESSSCVTVNGKWIPYCKYVYLMLHKPQGYVSAVEDKADPVVVSLVPEDLRHFNVFPVGRLDKDTEGLLLLTNDGQFDHALMSPRKEIFKRYYAELSGPLPENAVSLFREGMDLGDFTTKGAFLEVTEDPCKVYIEISEGKFHQVKRMCEKAGSTVTYLKRISIGPLKLDDSLAPGDVRALTEEELALLGYQIPLL